MPLSKHRPARLRLAVALGAATLLLLVLTASGGIAGGSGTVILKGARFAVEVARSAPEKARGLMFRKELPDSRGMFFLYDADGRHAIWMKNCKIPLDVLWVDSAGNVVEIAENVPPCPPAETHCPQYGGKVVSRYFIEFAAGTVARAGIRVGDPVGWDLTVPQEGRWIYLPGVSVRPIFQKE